MDEYGGDIDDAAFAAVADAAEKAHTASTSSSAAGPSKKPVVQPVPRKIQKPSGPSSIIVNTRQKGNPLLPYIKSVPWEYGDIIPDYLVTPTTCMLFLSLKYHRLHPEYIYTRMKSLGKAYTLRILLILIDTDQHTDPIKELTKSTMINGLTIILTWSAAEAGRYVELYKVMEHTPATMIKERQKEDYMSRVEDFATTVRGVNKTDSLGLISMFGSVRAAVNATEDQIGLVPGWGEKKTRRWCAAVREDFRVGGALMKKRREEAAKSGKDSGSMGTAVPLNVMKDEDRVAINRRLGIAPPAKMVKEVVDDNMIIDLDGEEALRAMEDEERRRKKPQGQSEAAAIARDTNMTEATTSSIAGTEDGVMAALAKLRKQ
ncbi:ssDNA endonuclease and repair protein rad10 [Orbilia ellipsospora]|uniref:SsDNA endonuclease and repair protein rad10 n=1 Tax=Orbilia ellipsospora TaxID=2528407 RepID=A0AAV9WYL4_9PEZI